jgi:hypothetical protein
MSTDDNHGSPAFATVSFDCRPDFSVEPGSIAAATGRNSYANPNNQ